MCSPATRLGFKTGVIVSLSDSMLSARNLCRWIHRPTAATGLGVRTAEVSSILPSWL